MAATFKAGGLLVRIEPFSRTTRPSTAAGRLRVVHIVVLAHTNRRFHGVGRLAPLLMGRAPHLIDGRDTPQRPRADPIIQDEEHPLRGQNTIALRTIGGDSSRRSH